MRQSSCGTLNLPVKWACDRCKPSIEKAKITNQQNKLIKSCIKPWDEKFKNHRESSKAQRYEDIHQHLETVWTESFIDEDNNATVISKDIRFEDTTDTTKRPPATPSKLLNSFSSSAKVNCVTPLSLASACQNDVCNAHGGVHDLDSNCIHELVYRAYLQGVQDGKSSTQSIIHNNSNSAGPNTTTAEICAVDNNSINNLGGQILSKIRYKHKEGKSRGEMFHLPVPTTHDIIYKSHLKILESKAKKFDTIMTMIKSNKYVGGYVGNKMLGMAASLVPQAGYSGLATILPFGIGAFLSNAGIDYDVKSLVNMLPSRNKIEALVTSNAIDTVMLTKHSLKDSSIYLSCDKGNKHGNKNLAKYICWFDSKEGKVKTFLLDVDCTEESTEAVVDALNHSLKKIFNNNNLESCISGQCTDSGGGGTLHALCRELKLRNLCSSNYITCSCSLHNLQTCLRNAIVNVMGDGGEDENGAYAMNCMQMLHGAYNLQNWAEHGELKQLHEFFQDDGINEFKFKKLEQPIVTRWWLVGACACSLKESFPIWKQICHALRNASPSGSALYKISSCTLNLMGLPPILFDFELLCAFHKFFLFPHFKFLQGSDPMTGSTPSFLCRHMLVRYFIMVQDIDKLSEDRWKDEIVFSDVLHRYNTLDENEKVIATKKISHFIRYVKESLTKHFKQWCNELFFLSIFSNKETATVIAKYVLGQSLESCSGIYCCDFHKCSINMLEFVSFLTCNVSNDTVYHTRMLPFVTENSTGLRLIASGQSLWGQCNDATLVSLRKKFLKRFAAVPTNTQFTERGVKECGYVSLGRRSEKKRSILAMSRGKLLPDALQKGHDEINYNVLHDNQERKAKQLCGKKRTRYILEGIFDEVDKINSMKIEMGHTYEASRKAIKELITEDDSQFKKRRQGERIEKVIHTANDSRQQNVYERRTGQTLTPLLLGKIQYAKLIKKHNMQQIKDELNARGITYDHQTNWTDMIKKLKNDEGDNKFFHPRIPYDNYKWNSTHFDENGEVI